MRRHMKFWRSWKRREAREAELERELRDHLDLEAEEQQEAGLSPEEAAYAARRALGNTVRIKEDVRMAWGFQWLETLLQDLRYGLRQLRRDPGFTVVAVLTLALGIGANTAIFSVVNGVLLKPLPYPHPEELVAVWLTAPGLHIDDLNPSPADYVIYREQNRTFQDIGLYMGNSKNVTGLAEPEHVAGLDVTDGLLSILGVTPILGRSFTRADDIPGSAKTVILSYGYWQRKFGGDRSVIGKTINVDGDLRQIIGVLPRDFHFGGSDVALLVPVQFDRSKMFLGNYSWESVARHKPGVALEQASADVARMLPIVMRSFPPPPGYSLNLFTGARVGPNLRTLKQDVVGDVGKVLWVLMGGIGLVLLIACANVANLLLVRAEGRQQELAIRAALGASRGRIAAGLLLESFILALCGSALGLALAYAALRALVAMAPTGLPRLNEIGVDLTVVLFTFVVSLAASLLFGSVPVLKYAGASLAGRLREGGRSMSEGRERQRARGALVIVQVALALVLLISSGLMIRTFRALTKVDPGFVAPAGLQTFRVGIPETEVKEPEQVVHKQAEMLDKIQSITGVSSAAFSMSVPMDGINSGNPILAKDRAEAPGGLPIRQYRFIAPGFFKTLGMPLLAGRDLTWSDIYNKVPVAIVSARLARECWGDPAHALGKEIRSTTKDDWREIIGVVGDTHDDGMDKEPPSSVYWPILAAHFQSNDMDVQRYVTFSIRSPRAGSASFMSEIEKAVWSVDPNLPLAEVHTLDYYYSRSMARTSFTLVMLAAAGGMALLLGIIGLYGVIAYSVSQRTHEIGIRVALGAQKNDVFKLVVGQGMILAMIGVAIGIVSAFGVTRFLAGLLFGVKPTDPLTFLSVALVLTAVALLASYIPARRATTVDPMTALRWE
jgi:putative ABC transport system permease protein